MSSFRVVDQPFKIQYRRKNPAKPDHFSMKYFMPFMYKMVQPKKYHSKIERELIVVQLLSSPAKTIS
jgi:hypothetical protein